MIKKILLALSIIGTATLTVLYLLTRKPVIDKSKAKIKGLKKDLQNNADKIEKLKHKEAIYKEKSKQLEKKITTKIRNLK